MRLIRNFLIVTIFLSINSPVWSATDAPPIKLPGLDQEVSLEKLIGKVVYLDFWASWCKPCLKSFPWMKEIKDKYADLGLEILAVNLDKDRKLADEFIDRVEVNFLIGFDPQGDTATSYQLRGMPSSFLLGRDGKIYATHIGFRDKDKPKIEQAIRQLLKQ